MAVSQRLRRNLVTVSCVTMLAFCVLAAALADELTTTSDPESLGFSAARLARIGSWYQERVNAGDLSGSVVAMARDGRLVYLQAVGFQDRDKTMPMNQIRS